MPEPTDQSAKRSAPPRRLRTRRAVKGVRPWHVIAAVVVVIALALGGFAVASGWRPWGYPPVGNAPLDTPGALKFWTRLTVEQPGNAEVWYQLGLVESQSGKSAVALGHLAKAAALSPSDPRYADRLARAYVQFARYADAAGAWESLAKGTNAAVSTRAGWMMDAAEAWAQAGDKARARADVQSAMKLIPGDLRGGKLLETLK